MADARKNALLEGIRVWPGAEHSNVVVGFQHQEIGACDSFPHLRRHISQIGCDRNTAPIRCHEAVAIALGTVMRNGKRLYVHAGALHSLFRERKGRKFPVQDSLLLQSQHSAGGGIDRNFMPGSKHTQAADMIAVLVGDKMASMALTGISQRFNASVICFAFFPASINTP